MKLASARRRRDSGLPGIAGIARVDRRTPALLRRLTPGDIAVLDHLDLDRVSAEALVAAGVAAVVNAAPSISGRYPALGPEILLAAGIPLLDAVGPRVFTLLRDGTHVRLDGELLYAGVIPVAAGQRQDEHSVAAALDAARSGLAAQLESFAASTVEYVRTERELLLDGVGIPAVATRIAGRHVVVVARGYDDRADLAALRPYLREYRPVLVGVNAGADTLLEAGHRPDLVFGDLAELSDQALTCGAELVLRTDGGHPRLDRVPDGGPTPVLFAAAGAAEDLALLLAHAAGAALIVTVGVQATLAEFLDRARTQTASTFLIRLRVGGCLVDAKAAHAMVHSRVSAGALLLLVLAALVAVAASLAVARAGQPLAGLMTGGWHRLAHWLEGLIA